MQLIRIGIQDQYDKEGSYEYLKKKWTKFSKNSK